MTAEQFALAANAQGNNVMTQQVVVDPAKSQIDVVKRPRGRPRKDSNIGVNQAAQKKPKTNEPNVIVVSPHKNQEGQILE